MNERINELARQTDSNCDAKLPDYTQRWNQMFAELIVRECAGIAHGSDMPSRDIKEHFGVKK